MKLETNFLLTLLHIAETGEIMTPSIRAASDYFKLDNAPLPNQYRYRRDLTAF